MSDVLVDTSVLLTWFHAEGESEVHAARAVRRAHHEELITVHIIDLAVYELGNVLLRSLRWAASDVADQLVDLLAICGRPVWLPEPPPRPLAGSPCPASSDDTRGGRSEPFTPLRNWPG